MSFGSGPDDEFLPRLKSRQEKVPEPEWSTGLVVIPVLGCLIGVAVLFGAPQYLFGLAVAAPITALAYSLAKGAWKANVNDVPARSVVRQADSRVTPAVLAPGFLAVRARLGRLAAAYATYESDPLRVLRLPALADVRVPATARFVDDLAAAMVLDVDGPSDQVAVDRFNAAVSQAERSWQAARETALRIHDASIPPAERAAVSRVLTLLNVARRTPIEGERLAAYAKARSELARLEAAGAVRLPRAAQLALAERARRELTSGDGVS